MIFQKTCLWMPSSFQMYSGCPFNSSRTHISPVSADVWYAILSYVNIPYWSVELMTRWKKMTPRSIRRSELMEEESESGSWLVAKSEESNLKSEVDVSQYSLSITSIMVKDLMRDHIAGLGRCTTSVVMLRHISVFRINQNQNQEIIFCSWIGSYILLLIVLLSFLYYCSCFDLLCLCIISYCFLLFLPNQDMTIIATHINMLHAATLRYVHLYVFYQHAIYHYCRLYHIHR